MAPRLSRSTTWKEFLPISMPATAIAVLSFEDIGPAMWRAAPSSPRCLTGKPVAMLTICFEACLVLWKMWRATPFQAVGRCASRSAVGLRYTACRLSHF
jgi:hypothetical protein